MNKNDEKFASDFWLPLVLIVTSSILFSTGCGGTRSVKGERVEGAGFGWLAPVDPSLDMAGHFQGRLVSSSMLKLEVAELAKSVGGLDESTGI